MKDTLPKFYEFMLPVLKLFEDGNSHTRVEIKQKMMSSYTSEQLSVVTPGRNKGVVADRVGWAIQYLRFANALENTSRGEYKLAANGKKLLNENKKEITVDDLKQFEEFNNVFNQNEKEKVSIESTPDDAIRSIIEDNNKFLKKQIIDSIMRKDPYFFENIILDLLSKMGYGRTEVTPKAHDNGFDGIIYQDRLGVDRIYTQAKRYKEDHPVQQTEIDKFIGVLHQSVTKSNKGIFITTSYFNSGATKRVNSDSTINIVLIDGDELVKLMIEYGVGVNTKETYTLKEIDEEYFE